MFHFTRLPGISNDGLRDTVTQTADGVPGSTCLPQDTPCMATYELGFSEGAAGSKPGHLGHKTAAHMTSDDLPFWFRLSRCPILGARWERAGFLTDWIPASSRSVRR